MKPTFDWDAEFLRLLHLQRIVAEAKARAARQLKPAKFLHQVGLGMALCVWFAGNHDPRLGIPAILCLAGLVHTVYASVKMVIERPIHRATACVHAAEGRLIKLQSSGGNGGTAATSKLLTR